MRSRAETEGIFSLIALYHNERGGTCTDAKHETASAAFVMGHLATATLTKKKSNEIKQADREGAMPTCSAAHVADHGRVAGGCGHTKSAATRQWCVMSSGQGQDTTLTREPETSGSLFWLICNLAEFVIPHDLRDLTGSLTFDLISGVLCSGLQCPVGNVL